MVESLVQMFNIQYNTTGQIPSPALINSIRPVGPLDTSTENTIIKGSHDPLHIANTVIKGSHDPLHTQNTVIKRSHDPLHTEIT